MRKIFFGDRYQPDEIGYIVTPRDCFRSPLYMLEQGESQKGGMQKAFDTVWAAFQYREGWSQSPQEHERSANTKLRLIDVISDEAERLLEQSYIIGHINTAMALTAVKYNEKELWEQEGYERHIYDWARLL